MMLALVALARAAMAAPPAPSAPSGTSEPDWLKVPNGDDLVFAFPRAAVEAGKNGRAVIRCEVTVEGLLENCSVVSETPPGLGYGEAALQLTPEFQMRPKKVNGTPVRGTVVIPINFGGVENLRDARFSEIAVHPQWETAPTRADVLAAYPKHANVSGKAMLECTFDRRGGLTSCFPVWSEPRGKGFDDAARKLASKFKGPTKRADGKSASGVRARIPFYFGPGGATPKADPDALAGALTWVSTADQDAADALFPAQARAAKAPTGHVTLKCVIQPQGKLGDCAVESETPAGLGFGDAAQKLSAMFRVNPWTDDGRPLDGDEVRLHLRLDTPDPKPAAVEGAAQTTPKP